MKSTKLTTALIAIGMMLTIGASALGTSVPVEAATVVSETAYEKVMSFTKEDLNKATKVSLSASSVSNVYNAMTKSNSWTKLGYTEEEAKLIANRISISYYQTRGILNDIVANDGLEFKVILVNHPNYKTVNIGTIGKVVEPSNPEKPEVPSKPVEPELPTNPTLSSIVEDIEIDIEYRRLGDIELDYEVKSNGRIEAKIKNKQTGVKIKDAQAQKIIEDLFVGLDAKKMNHTSIQNHVLTKLNAPKSDLKKFKFEVKYADRSKVDFKIKY